jgi:hypothetical protein
MISIITNPNTSERISRDKIHLHHIKKINIVNIIIIRSRIVAISIDNLHHNLAKNGALNSKR